jgi:hypothetical protein
MALIIDNGTTGAGANHTATGVTEVIASGSFGSASVQITAFGAGQSPAAPVYTFSGPGAISVQAAPNTTLRAEIVGGEGGEPTPVIDVSMSP